MGALGVQAREDHIVTDVVSGVSIIGYLDYFPDSNVLSLKCQGSILIKEIMKS